MSRSGETGHAGYLIQRDLLNCWVERVTTGEGLGMRKWWPLAAVCAGAFMLLVDGMLLS